MIEGEFVDLERQVEGLADLVDRRAARGEVRHHRLGDRLRERRHPLRDDAVIAGVDGDQRRMGTCGRSDRCQPARKAENLPELPEGACGLGKLRLPLALAAAMAASSGPGICLRRARISSNGRAVITVSEAGSGSLYRRNAARRRMLCDFTPTSAPCGSRAFRAFWRATGGLPLAGTILFRGATLPVRRKTSLLARERRRRSRSVLWLVRPKITMA